MGKKLSKLTLNELKAYKHRLWEENTRTIENCMKIAQYMNIRNLNRKEFEEYKDQLFHITNKIYRFQVKLKGKLYEKERRETEVKYNQRFVLISKDQLFVDGEWMEDLKPLVEQMLELEKDQIKVAEDSEKQSLIALLTRPAHDPDSMAAAAKSKAQSSGV